MKSYKMEIKTIGPLHIGCGISIGKKEYIFNQQKGLVLVPDYTKMYVGLQKLRLERQFQEYILGGNTGMDLGRWLSTNRVNAATYNPWIRYTMTGGDHLKSGKRPIQIETFQKDNYGLPYVPGTAIKGMLRTILLAYEIMKEPLQFKRAGEELASAATRRDFRTRYLKKNADGLEETVFHTLDRKDQKGKPIARRNAVNDSLSGLIISDSEPLPLKVLTLCQKLDRSVEGNYNNSLNTLRESIKPGTPISFQLTIDETLCSYTIKDIMEAVQKFSEAYYSLFLSAFKGTDMPAKNTIWLGGGTGFFTKTVVYPLLGKTKGLTTVVDIFDQTLSKRAKETHKHYKDREAGVSPHMLKCTEYEGRTFQMGMCSLKVCEETVL